MLVFYMFSHVFPMFSNIFHTFSWTNLFTSCLVPAYVFCMFLVLEKLYRKYSRIELIIYEEFLFTETETKSKGQHQGRGPAPRRPWNAAQGPPTPWGHLVALASP